MSFLLLALHLLALLACWTIIYQSAYHLGARVLGFSPPSEFVLGFGPLIWSFTSGATRYELRLLPLGGYSRFGNELDIQSRFGRHFCLLLCGPLAVAMLGALLIYAVNLCGIDVSSRSGVLIRSVEPGSKYGGIRPGDIVLAINERSVNKARQLAIHFGSWESGAFKVEFERDGEVSSLVWYRQKGQSRETVLVAESLVSSQRFGPLQAAINVCTLTRLVIGALARMVVLGTPTMFSEPTYPGQVLFSARSDQVREHVLRIGMFGLLFGLTNLLPVEPFLGFQVLQAGWRWYTRSPLTDRSEFWFTCGSLAVCAILMLSIILGVTIRTSRPPSRMLPEAVQYDEVADTWSTRV